MDAVILAIGSELLRAGRRNTNAAWLTERLVDLGIETGWSAAVGDTEPDIAALVRAALERAAVVLVTGGLGPTEDDRTRGGLAAAFAVPLERDPDVERALIARFAARGRTAGPAQFRQADRPRGTHWIPNPIGSAPGILAERDGRLLAALPGVPAEMKAMFDATVAPRIAALPGARGGLARRTVRIAGRAESAVDAAVSDLYGTPSTETTILSSAGMVELIVSAYGTTRDEADSRAAELAAVMASRMGDDVFGGEGASLAAAVGAQLAARGLTIAVGESCTGGLVGGAITDVPGSSRWFRGGLICYADDLKTALAGVPVDVLARGGAVSEHVARALAAGARRACAADVGVGVTGIAGPDGGTPDKPVGTVHIAVADRAGDVAVRLDGPGDRDLVRRRAVAAALDLVRRRLLAR